MIMWTDTVDQMTAQCEYIKETHQFKVSVLYKGKEKTKNFPASFEPIFGMDILDQNQSGIIAEELAKELEAENE